MKGCKPNFDQSCSQESNQFTLVPMAATNFWGLDYDVFQNGQSEASCQESCRIDCFCAAVVFNGSTRCWKKRFPLSNGWKSNGSGTISASVTYGSGTISASVEWLWYHKSNGSGKRGLIPFGLMLLIAECGARTLYTPPTKADKTPKQLQTFRPFNIAHRGSNGVLPEETEVAYKRAIEEGADFIETDISSSKDGVLICFHDLILDKTTDVSSYKEFADRKRTYEVQGFNRTGFFTVDFTWKELQKLKTRQRYPFRDQQYNGKFPIITFKDYISIALNASRVVGIYPEIKNPVFINEHVKWPNGKKFEDMFVETLKEYRYKGSYLSKDWLKQPIFIQSFAPTSLVYIANLTDLPKLLLIDDRNVSTQDTNQTYQEITSDTYFDYIKHYVVGIGPWKDTIVPALNNNLQTPTDLVDRAHAHGLQVHPYTYRNENQFLHFDFHQDPYNEYEYWIKKIGVDGLFTDFTGSLHSYQEWVSAAEDSEVSVHRRRKDPYH